jgi:hypothetical protein
LGFIQTYSQGRFVLRATLLMPVCICYPKPLANLVARHLQISRSDFYTSLSNPTSSYRFTENQIMEKQNEPSFTRQSSIDESLQDVELSMLQYQTRTRRSSLWKHVLIHVCLFVVYTIIILLFWSKGPKISQRNQIYCTLPRSEIGNQMKAYDQI